MLLPRLYAAGLFDSTVKFSTMKESPERTCDMYEIEFHNSESGTSYINGKAHKICYGAVICAKPGQRRHSILPLRSHYLHVCTDSEEVNRLLNSIPDFFTVSDVEKYVELVRKISLSHKFGDERDAFRTNSLILELFYQLSGEDCTATQIDKKYKNSAVVTEAIKYMDEQFSHKCSLADVAAHVNFSPIYFHNLFKKVVGVTPYQYIIARRMRLAREYLTVSDKTIAEIAENCGFESQSYFNYAFSKEVGMTPGQYRRQAMDKYLI